MNDSGLGFSMFFFCVIDILHYTIYYTIYYTNILCKHSVKRIAFYFAEWLNGWCGRVSALL